MRKLRAAEMALREMRPASLADLLSYLELLDGMREAPWPRLD
jgi:hypothetical protein